MEKSSIVCLIICLNNIIMRQALLLFAFLPYLLSAQSEYAEGRALQFNGGLIGGATASQIHGDGIGGFNKVGLNMGATIEIGRRGKKNIQIGIAYNQKGSKKPPNPPEDYDTWKYRFTYIDIPITMSYSYKMFDILVGLQPSICLQQKKISMAWLGTQLACPSKNMTWELCWEYAQSMGITLIFMHVLPKAFLPLLHAQRLRLELRDGTTGC